MSYKIRDSFLRYSSFKLGDGFLPPTGVAALPPVPPPQSIRADIRAFRQNQGQNFWDTRFEWVAPETDVDGYETRISFIGTWQGNSALSQLTAFSNFIGSGLPSDENAWFEVRSVLDGRFSEPLRISFSEFTFPTINAPTQFVVEVDFDDGSRFEVTLNWVPPTNAWGRTVSYQLDRGGGGFSLHNAPPVDLDFNIPRSTFPYFEVLSIASDGSRSAGVRVVDADYDDNSGRLLVINNRILVINNKVLVIPEV